MSDKTRILIVDDEKELRAILATILTKSGYEVVEADDGANGKAFLEQETFDVIISDIKMPRMSGIDLFKWNKKNKNIPTILITGFSELIETQQAYDMGIKEFLAKPFHKEEILAAVRNCLNAAHSEKSGTGSISTKETKPFVLEECTENNHFLYDIYLQLSKDKFIKIASKGAPIPNDDFNPDNFSSYSAVILVKKR